ncbi:hypothetical protein [uncultured Hyphomicrobium sp.]|jgi:hypothetical protein|uniref:hypothetical protein n=1 Tax=uncultured Hyphomicrobium sp. TaxID=194373 RepID=UPI0025EDC7A9|nr:hypothetical protein [uncultured Hyphomicrobium sp.]
MNREPYDDTLRQEVVEGGLLQEAIKELGVFGFVREVIRAWVRHFQDWKEANTPDEP